MYEAFEKLEEQKRKNKFKNYALTIAKYKKFKTSAILRNLPKDIDFGAKATQHKYVYAGVRYLEDGIVDKSCPKELYKELDDCKFKCIQPLTPSSKDQRIKAERKAKAIPNKPQKLKYGIIIDNTIKMLEDKNSANTFASGVKFTNENIKIKVISFEIKEEMEA